MDGLCHVSWVNNCGGMEPCRGQGGVGPSALEVPGGLLTFPQQHLGDSWAWSSVLRLEGGMAEE